MANIDYTKVKTCDKCGGIFESFSEGNYCQDCHKKLEEKLEDVRMFIGANKGASLEEVVVALKVDRKQLIVWIRESRLRFSEVSGVTVPCNKCGKPIGIGMYCSVCTTEMVTELESAYEKPDKNAGVEPQKAKFVKMNVQNRREHRKL